MFQLWASLLGTCLTAYSISTAGTNTEKGFQQRNTQKPYLQLWHVSQLQRLHWPRAFTTSQKPLEMVISSVAHLQLRHLLSSEEPLSNWL
jgi:hypothetical protein